jgi:hypothetical protein
MCSGHDVIVAKGEACAHDGCLLADARVERTRDLAAFGLAPTLFFEPADAQHPAVSL